MVTGLSGSGKSSLAFDTLYAGRTKTLCRESVSLCSSVLGNMEKARVDSIDGLSPAISIDQKQPAKTAVNGWNDYRNQRLLTSSICSCGDSLLYQWPWGDYRFFGRANCRPSFGTSGAPTPTNSSTDRS